MSFQPEDTTTLHTIDGSLDGEGAGDHDVPFSFGRRPRTAAPYPFSTRQFARLLVLRSRVHALSDSTVDCTCGLTNPLLETVSGSSPA